MRSTPIIAAFTAFLLLGAVGCDPTTEEVEEVEFPGDPVPPGVEPIPEEREEHLEPVMPPMREPEDTVAPEEPVDPFPPAGVAEDPDPEEGPVRP